MTLPCSSRPVHLSTGITECCRVKETETETETEKDRDRDRDKDRETQTDTDRHTHTQTPGVAFFDQGNRERERE